MMISHSTYAGTSDRTELIPWSSLDRGRNPISKIDINQARAQYEGVKREISIVPQSGCILYDQSYSQPTLIFGSGNWSSHKLLISDLGWTVQEAKNARNKLIIFEDDWDYPGMEDYDAL